MKKIYLFPGLLSLLFSCWGHAAVTPDRSRVIFDGGEKSVSVTLSNNSDKHPYLAQSWLENAQKEKVTSPLVVLPPLLRIEPKSDGQVKILGMPALSHLPQDRESLFYFNVREIPPKSDKPNTLQIALQTRLKLFYRPAALAKQADLFHPWQHKITLNRLGDRYQVNNPTPYYVVLIGASESKNGPSPAGFEPLMLAPLDTQPLSVNASALERAPVLTYVNDYGARLPLFFICSGDRCQVDDARSIKQQ
ncbi:fimbria/pilus periplasmic chaperone [Escherichia coli]|nr:fimbria/pilus periplasmic chaperone [Escherichia coli]